MQDLPIIFLIQGSFQTPAVYEQLVQRLHTLGFVTVQPRLPSGSNTESPDFSKTTLVDDALAMRLELVRQIEYDGKTVLVAMHSYGGLVGSEAIPEELSHSKRQALGLPGGVIHLFYFSAFILNEGQSVLGTFGEASNTRIDVSGCLSRSQLKCPTDHLSRMTAESRSWTASKSSTATFRSPKPPFGPLALLQVRTVYKKRSSLVLPGDIYRRPTSFATGTRLSLRNSRRVLQQAPTLTR